MSGERLSELGFQNAFHCYCCSCLLLLTRFLRASAMPTWLVFYTECFIAVLVYNTVSAIYSIKMYLHFKIYVTELVWSFQHFYVLYFLCEDQKETFENHGQPRRNWQLLIVKLHSETRLKENKALSLPAFINSILEHFKFKTDILNTHVTSEIKNFKWINSQAFFI
jgi:hypothetical protein